VVDEIPWEQGKVVFCPPNPGERRRCALCGDIGLKPSAVFVANPEKAGDWMRVRTCAACDCYFFEPYKLVGLLQESRAALDFYIELGAGVDVMSQLLCQIPKPRGATLLEVGCGYGFSLDVWQSAYGGRALGIEPAWRGEAGKQELGVHIIPDYLVSCMTLPGEVQRFDVISSMEVIEHIPEPPKFIALLAEFLKPDGVLMLTTPNPASLEARQVTPDVYATLSPGYHTILMSELGLEKLLRDAGFPYVISQSSPIQLKVFASREPLQLRKTDLYTDYLRDRLKRSEPGTALHLGMAYRLYQAVVNAGAWEEAAHARTLMETSLRAAFGPEILDQDERLQRARRIREIPDFTGQLPFFMSELEYLWGVHEVSVHRDYPRAAAHFRAADEMVARFCVMPPLLSTVGPGRWKIRFEEAHALSQQGGEEAETGLQIWQEMAAGEDGIPAEWARKARMARLRHYVIKGEWAPGAAELEVLHGEWKEQGKLPPTPEEWIAALRPGDDDALWYGFARAFLALSAAAAHPEAENWFRRLAEGCGLLPGSAVAVSLYRNAHFHASLAAEYTQAFDRAAEGYRWLIDHPEPDLGPGEEPAAWAARAEERLKKMAEQKPA